MVFGLAYGECFGPTGLVPAGWIAPMDDPLALLVAGVGLGAVLLAGAYALGTVNRVREGGWAYALYAPSGLAGAALFLAAGLTVASWYLSMGALAVAAVLLAVVGLVLAYLGRFAAAGRGAAGALQAGVELVDLVIRLGANVVSFARLAAFGLTHAVLGWVVWTGTTALWHDGGVSAVWAVVLFIVGNAVAFGLEALVAAIQALRLEYYELFSRVFEAEGRPFRPWTLPTVPAGPVRGEITMYAWLIALPALAGGAAVTVALLRRRSRHRGASTSSGECGPARGCADAAHTGGDRRERAGRDRDASGRGAGRHRGRRRHGTARRGDRGGGLVDRSGHRRGLHRGGRARGHERTTRAVRPCHGDRRSGRRHRHLRPHRRHHPDREGLTMRVAAVGAETAVRGYGLAGVLVYAATDPDGVRAAWQALPDDVALVIVTRAAADALADAALRGVRPVVAVMPA